MSGWLKLLSEMDCDIAKNMAHTNHSRIHSGAAIIDPAADRPGHAKDIDDALLSERGNALSWDNHKIRTAPHRHYGSGARRETRSQSFRGRQRFT